MLRMAEASQDIGASQMSLNLTGFIFLPTTQCFLKDFDDVTSIWHS